MVPHDLKMVLKPAMTEDEEECYMYDNIPGFTDPIEQDVFIFKLEDCALKALLSVNRVDNTIQGIQLDVYGMCLYMYMFSIHVIMYMYVT